MRPFGYSGLHGERAACSVPFTEALGEAKKSQLPVLKSPGVPVPDYFIINYWHLTAHCPTPVHHKSVVENQGYKGNKRTHLKTSNVYRD